MKKRIVQIVRAPAGGIRKHVLEIINGLTNTEIFLITNEEDGDLGYKKYLEEHPELTPKILNVNIIDSPCFGDILNIIKIYNHIRILKVDILHGHGAKGGLYARIVGFLLGKKTIYTAHGGSLHLMHGKLKNILYSVIERILYFFTTKLVFESKYSMKEYERRVHNLSDKFILNYNSIKIPSNYENLTLKEINQEEVIVIGAFGLLRKIKGHDILIRACSILKEKKINLELRIFGDGEEKESLISLSREVDFESELKINEYTENVQSEMKKCHIIAHPSLFESFGYVPIEALINGITVVSPLEGGLKEVMNNGELGFCFEELNETNLAEAIERAILNSRTREEKFQKSKEYIKKNFDRKKFIDGFKQIYEV